MSTVNRARDALTTADSDLTDAVHRIRNERDTFADAITRSAALADKWAEDSAEHHARGAHNTADILFFCAADLKRTLEGQTG